MKCDYCNNENKEDLIFGRWIVYCKKCKDNGGEDEDRRQFLENEIGEDFSGAVGLDGEGQEMLEKMF